MSHPHADAAGAADAPGATGAVGAAQPGPTPTGAIVRVSTPEERAYARRMRQVEARRRRLAELEAELALLKGALGRFEAVCRARVGGVLADLRRVDEATADYRGRIDRLRNPNQPEPETDADDEVGPGPGDDEPGEDPFGAGEAGGPADLGAPAGANRAAPRSGAGDEAEAKRLYRDLAKRCHPDFARNDGDRARRVAMMQRVNEAYRARDLDGLRGLRLETEAADPGFAARPPGERLAWAVAEVERLDALLEGVKATFARLRGYELHRLWRRYEAGEAVLDELEDDLEARLRAKNRRLDGLIAAYLQLRGEPARRRRTGTKPKPKPRARA